MVPALMVFFIGLVGVLALVPLFSLLDDRHRSRRAVNLLTGSAILLGYFGGGTEIWWFVPPEWHLSFWETLAASVNARKYGHPVEHYAESILVLMLLACVVGAVISAALAATAIRLLKRRQHA